MVVHSATAEIVRQAGAEFRDYLKRKRAENAARRGIVPAPAAARRRAPPPPPSTPATVVPPVAPGDPLVPTLMQLGFSRDQAVSVANQPTMVALADKPIADRVRAALRLLSP